MSRRRRAIEAFDALDTVQWREIAPRKPISREAFRECLESGRVDPKVVLHNISILAEIATIEQQLNEALDRIEPMRIRRAVDARGLLEVVA